METFIPTYLIFLITATVLYLWYKDRQSMQEERKMFDEERKIMHATWVQERKDLYDRIQSTSFVEYKDNVPDQTPEAVDEPIVDLEDAREELMGEEIDGDQI